jgi:outer membrane receptor for ferrienterochelin and colicins
MGIPDSPLRTFCVRVFKLRRANIVLALSLSVFPLTSGGAQEKGADTIPLGSLTVRVRHLTEPIPGAMIRADSLRALADSAGNATLRLPSGPQTIIASRLGFVPDTLSIDIALGADTAIEVQLSPSVVRLAEIIVGASRVERRVQDEPERVEVLSGEDVGEKTVMRPSNPMSLVSEMPGVRVQTTSPALGGAGVRLQGLRGRYTLLLADGLPLYGSSSEGLGFLQIPPLDLAQAEVIKGAATALYGPAAAGGVLNLVSRRPPRGGRGVHELLLNQTSRRGTDGLVWSGARLSKQWDYTILAGAHHQTTSDVDVDGWTDIPGLRRFEVRPRAFWADSLGSSAMITAGAVDEDRRSGTSGAALSRALSFPITARTRRGDAGTVIRMVTKRGGVVSIRASINQQWQDRRYGDSTESDRRGTAFAEITHFRNLGKHETLLGVGLQNDGLSSAKLSNVPYQFLTGSVFGQDTYSATEKLSVSATARLDHHDRYGTFLSPRVSALSRFAGGWAARVSAGGGFFAPTPLVEEADVVGLSRVRGFSLVSPERITQASADLTRTLGPFEITGTLFGARLNHAVVVSENSPTPGVLTLTNAPTPTRAGGASFFAVYNQEPFAVTALYSYTRSTEWSPELARRVETSLTPRHASGLDIAFEEDDIGTRVGLEIFYTGRQRLDDDPYRAFSVPYTTFGLLVEQSVGSATLFVNAEDLPNMRQTRFDPLLLPRQDPTGRWTTPEWAPLEGRMLNAGVRVHF